MRLMLVSNGLEPSTRTGPTGRGASPKSRVAANPVCDAEPLRKLLYEQMLSGDPAVGGLPLHSVDGLNRFLSTWHGVIYKKILPKPKAAPAARVGGHRFRSVSAGIARAPPGSRAAHRGLSPSAPMK